MVNGLRKCACASMKINQSEISEVIMNWHKEDLSLADRNCEIFETHARVSRYDPAISV